MAPPHRYVRAAFPHTAPASGSSVEAPAPVPARRFAHAPQPVRRASPALCPVRGRLRGIPLGRSPSLHSLRQRRAAFVRLLLRYYATVRLPTAVHVGHMASGLPRPAPCTIAAGRLWDLPVPVRKVSTHTQGLRLRGSGSWLASSASSRFAFRITQRRRPPGFGDFAAQWLVCVCPCQRFARPLAESNA